MRFLTIAAFGFSVAACTVPQDTRGGVYDFNGETVTIRGVFDPTPGSGFAKPTEAMVAQAKEVCPGATYLSASPSPTDNYTFLYLFRC